ncbi:MAG: hypothetical protein CMH27_03430 [Micavibrio sp.]|nr:hypothetical protein [Micavibrio sp.]|tara:strand:+ start:3415 stop:4536 length:1122 start_codon:yes stop_codon:yes gene_type:complete
MSAVTKDQIIDALKTVRDEEQGADIVSLDMVKGLQISGDGTVIFMIEVSPSRGTQLEPLRQNAEQTVLKIKGVNKVSAVLTAEAKHTPKAAASGVAPAPTKSNIPDPHGLNKIPPLDIHAKHIIAVASGKGGVGKSTVTANICANLAKNGHKVGLLDADIYGPSQPHMMGLDGKKPASDENNQIIPLEAHGIKVMSIGFMIEPEKALVWRGPMVQSALIQLMRDVAWGTAETPLDYLIVDMPPGTGDAQLTMAQKIKLSGAIIVSTPQDIALLDARKGIEMFRKTNVPVLGIIENMSTYICTNCGHEEHIFGHGGAQKEAKKLGTAFLGDIPLNTSIRINSDEGIPASLSAPESEYAKKFDVIAKEISTRLKT